MAISADKVRELIARGEGTAIDFKRQEYDWKTKPNEFAKDLMAMANSLPTGASSAYILLGVDDDGSIVGLPAHLDDAGWHVKVKHSLNRTPTFSYTSVDVGGASVGVVEIASGGRPFFPIRDAPPLVRHAALVRDGTSTDVASPAQILEWARLDETEFSSLWYLTINSDGSAEASVLEGRALDPPFRSNPAPGGQIFRRVVARATEEKLRITSVYEFNKGSGWMIFLNS